MDTNTFKYDPFGRRIQKAFTQGTTTTTSNYLYDGDNLVEEVDATGTVVTRYAQWSSIDEPLAMLQAGVTSYYHADGLGSVTSMTDATGALANTYSYDSFGNTTATGPLTNPFQYTARESDTETGLYYYRARYYNSALQRFISEDPIGFRGGIHKYAYVSSSPTNFVDPRGLDKRGFLDRAKSLARCAASLSQAGSVRSLSGDRVPKLLGSNLAGDIVGAFLGPEPGTDSTVGTNARIGQGLNAGAEGALEVGKDLVLEIETKSFMVNIANTGLLNFAPETVGSVALVGTAATEVTVGAI